MLRETSVEPVERSTKEWSHGQQAHSEQPRSSFLIRSLASDSILFVIL